MADEEIEPTQPDDAQSDGNVGDSCTIPINIAGEREPAPVATDDPEAVTGPSALPFPVVGIGASAGGVEALMELFDRLPINTGMSFVVVAHLAADSRSMLPEIIARQTAMKVGWIEDGSRPEPNHVYVVPAKSDVLLERGSFRIEPREGDGVPRPIDIFLRSLATDQRDRAVGIVLSGMDSDGALGLKAIKSEGGIAMVQSPESARFPNMPRSSISADHVDVILAPGDLAFELAQLARRFQDPALRMFSQGETANDEQQYARIVKLLKGVSGVDFRMYKPTTIRRRIARRMLLHRVDTLADYLALLQSDHKELRDLHEDALINVTRFFRDPEVFDAVKSNVLPAIFEDHNPDQQVRIWVAGCSSGEEVYSLAICVLEYLTGNPMEPPIQIFGTDASEQNIQKARAGIYPETITSEVSPERIRRFFSKNERGYQVSKRVRDLCIFARQNLCHDPPFSRMDLISCRNVLIYFGAELQRQLLPTFHYALRPNGYLLLGTSETIREFSDLFSLVDRRHKIFTKTGSSAPRALNELVPRVFMPEITPAVAHALPETRMDQEIQRAADRLVLARYGPPGAVVDESGEILQSRGHTSAFFEMAPGAATLQLARMVREGIAPQVTAAFQAALEQNSPVQVEGVQIHEGDQVREVTLEVIPLHSVGTKARCFLVLFVPSPKPAVGVTSRPAELSVVAGERDPSVAQLQRDLASTKLYLQSLLEEREGKNQELVSANEEIQSANEELQSTNEELETTKEELQSSNEELQTVNDELQNRNAILTQASNDLSNLLNSVNLPVLMLSSELNIRHFTPPTQRLMNLRASDIGRPFSDIRLNLTIDDLHPLFTEVLDNLTPQELEVQDRDGHWYLLRVRPYRTTDNKIDGLVVVLVDIDQLRRSQQELRDARDFARSVIEGIPLPLAVLDTNLNIKTTNEAFRALAGSNSLQLERRFFPDLAGSIWDFDARLEGRLKDLCQPENENKRFDFEHRTFGEPSRILLVRGCVLRPDGEHVLLVTLEDITAHKETERLLKAEGERLASEVASTTKELARSQQELRGLAGSLFTAQEEERRRVSRELHDDISQRLAKLDLDGDAIEEQIERDPGAVKERIRQLRKEIDGLAQDVRRVSHRLHPSILEDLGLDAALRSLVQEFGEREGMITTFSSQNLPDSIPSSVAMGLYRIAQEGLRNIAKHAGRSHVKVMLSGGADGLHLDISDSGVGFQPGGRRTGLGLVSMEERARLIGGTFNIHSAPGRGTRATVYVPLSAQQARDTADA